MDDDLQSDRREALEEGIPERVVDWWLGLARPQLVFRRMGDEQRASGVGIVGQFGGRPSLPADFEWTGFPEFVGSVDCAALPSDLPGFPLPADGSLLFFGAKDEDETSSSSLRPGQVLYVPAGTAMSERVPPGSAEEEAPLPLYYTRHWSFPHSADSVIIGNSEYSEIFDQYDLDSLSASFAGSGAFAVGGYTHPVNRDVCEALTSQEHLGLTDWRVLAEWQEELPPYRNLAYSYWLVSQKDLEAGRFDRVRMCREVWF